MSKNIFQVYQTNPITINNANDLMYFGQSPYGIGNDAVMTFSSFVAQIGAIITRSITGTSQSASINTRYIVANAAQTTINLPTTFAIGDPVIIKGLGAGGWILQAGPSTTIQIGQSVTSSGGSLTSAANFDTICVTGLVANSKWSVDYAFSSGLTIL